MLLRDAAKTDGTIRTIRTNGTLGTSRDGNGGAADNGWCVCGGWAATGPKRLNGLKSPTGPNPIRPPLAPLHKFRHGILPVTGSWAITLPA